MSAEIVYVYAFFSGPEERRLSCRSARAGADQDPVP